jgi:hypothetical protein
MIAFRDAYLQSLKINIYNSGFLFIKMTFKNKIILHQKLAVLFYKALMNPPELFALAYLSYSID